MTVGISGKRKLPPAMINRLLTYHGHGADVPTGIQNDQ